MQGQKPRLACDTTLASTKLNNNMVVVSDGTTSIIEKRNTNSNAKKQLATAALNPILSPLSSIKQICCKKVPASQK